MKLTKTPLIYSVSRFNLEGAWSFVWGDKPTKAPRGDGTAVLKNVFVTCWDFMAPPQSFGARELCPLAPLVTPMRSRGHFRYGVERAKRFVNVHWHSIVSNMEKISKISSLPPLEKFLRTPKLLT